ncbi:vWA domain-containing protein [Paraburkholderia unamae]|uniref:VWA-like domain-containing protein n=1 Tax=Paraburkholderia unamae TaxID=219649 RepID=A0ACC6RGT2_9BURK
MAQVSKMDKARTALVLDHPFFASILLRRPMKERKDIPILAIDKRGTIYYNEQACEKLSVPELVWGLAHECMHYMGQHAARMQAREHKKWNYATDAFINDTLTSAGVGQPIPDTVNMPGSKDKTCEDIYAELPDNPGGGGSGKGQGGGDGQQQQGLGDDILDEGGHVSEGEARQMEAQAKIEIAEAAQAAKMRGKLPAALADFVADFLASKTPWYEILERYMVSFTRQEVSWKRPNKRFAAHGIYLPTRAKHPSMGTLVCQIDVSGSISEKELAAYNGHLSRIIADVHPKKVHVLYVDTQVQKHQEFNAGDEVKLEFYSGGGTHMPAGFSYIEEHGIECDVFVCLTDGYTGFDQDPGFPTVWCISSNVEAPYGANVHFDLND